MNKIRIGIIGGAGYTGGEVLRLLLHHPFIEIAFISSRTHNGKWAHEIHRDVLGDTELRFINEFSHIEIDCAFLCLPHGHSTEVISQLSPLTRIIDLSQDYRIQQHPTREFVYGLPELHRDSIAHASNIANPGCFATAIQLSLLPLLNSDLKVQAIHSLCTTGSTGAGAQLSDTSHFSWRNNNLSVYKAFQHQHEQEINRTISLGSNQLPNITMIPQRGAFTRGIMSCITLTTSNPEQLHMEYEDYYRNEKFVYVLRDDIDLKQVINTNKCFINIQVHQDSALIIAIIDNLVKGAAGQAIQNMNIMYGFPEDSGLQLKASVY